MLDYLHTEAGGTTYEIPVMDTEARARRETAIRTLSIELFRVDRTQQTSKLAREQGKKNERITEDNIPRYGTMWYTQSKFASSCVIRLLRLRPELSLLLSSLNPQKRGWCRKSHAKKGCRIDPLILAHPLLPSCPIHFELLLPTSTVRPVPPLSHCKSTRLLLPHGTRLYDMRHDMAYCVVVM